MTNAPASASAAPAAVAMSPGASAELLAWNLPLIASKLHLPRPPRSRVARPELIARLQALASERALTLVVAPAGFGKTSLLVEWAQSPASPAPVTLAWVSLDEDDDELQAFGAYLLSALRQASQGALHRAWELLRQDPLTPVKTAVSVLINEIAAHPRPVFVVLDDFHRVQQPAIRETVQRLLRYAPDNLHLLLGTRGEPALNLGELRAREQLGRLGEADLRFSGPDAQAFFAQASPVALPPAGVARLHAATEGWVAGLQLAALALREGSGPEQVLAGLAGARCGIDRYLNDAVLAHLPAPVLDFLLRSAILERLSPALCDALRGSEADAPAWRAWDMLDWLERHNVFLRALDDQREWFRYHALLADALRRRLARQWPEQLPLLHRRAAQWFAQQACWPEAVRHALAGGDTAQGADWVERCALALVDRSDVATLLGWIARLPEPLLQTRPRLRLAQAWALALSLHSAEAGRIVAELREQFLCKGDAEAGPEARAGRELLEVEITAMEALIAGLMDDSPRSLALGEAAAALPAFGRAPLWVRRFADTARLFGLMYQPGQATAIAALHPAGRREPAVAASVPGSAWARAWTSAGAPDEPLYASVYRQTMLGLAALVAGDLHRAQAIFEAELQRAEQAAGRDSAAAVLPAGYLAALYCERNEPARAQQMLDGRETAAWQGCALGSLLRHSRATAHVLARQGQRGAALRQLAQVGELAQARHWLRLRAGCDAESVRLLLQDGQLGAAQRVAQALREAMPARLPEQPGSFLETWAHYLSIQARLLVADGHAADAAELLADLHHTLHRSGMAYLAARCALLWAQALDQTGRRTQAWAPLDAALRYAQTQPLLGSFIEEGEPLRSLLRAWLRRTDRPDDIPRPEVDRLLALCSPAWPTRTASLAVSGKAPTAALGLTLPDTPTPDSADYEPLASSADPLLSPREREILHHIARGLSNKEIGRALRVAPETIKWHVKNIYDKLHVGSRLDAVRVGLGAPVG